MFASPHFRRILTELLEKGAVTSLDLEAKGLNRQTISRFLRRLRALGVVRFTGTVGPPYVKNEARPPKIWALMDANPQASLEAQKRYGALIKANGGEGLEPSTVAEVVALFMDRDKVLRNDLLATIRAHGISGRQAPRYTEAVIRELSEVGVRVWR